MKQRLLMAFCFLLATWGMAKAENIELKIPAGETGKSVTVTIKNTQAVLKVGSSAYYPEFTPAVKPTISSDNKTATYKIPYLTSAQTLKLAGGADQLKDVEITVDGKVSEFKCTTATGLFNQVKKLTFTNNGELTAIDLNGFTAGLSYLNVNDNKLTELTGISKCTKITEIHAAKNKMTTLSINAALTELTVLDVSDNELASLTLPNEATKLKTVDISNNKLNYAGLNKKAIENIETNKGKLTWGIQTYALTTNLASLQSWYANATNNSLKKAIEEFFGTEAEMKDFTITWTKDGKSIKSYLSTSTSIPTGNTESIVQDAVYPDKFTFRNNSQYFYGTYACTITGNTKTDYAGITYKIPELKVTPAQFTFKEIVDANVYLDATTKEAVEAGKTVVTQGQSLTVYAKDKEGFQLDKFEISGLKLKESTLADSWAVFEVTGALNVKEGVVTPEEVSLKALYKPATYKLTVRATAGGTLEISYKDAQNHPVTVHDGSEIPYGAWLDITVLTEDNYTFKQLRDGYDTEGENALKPEEGNANHFKLEVKKDVDLVPVFEKITQAVLTFKYPKDIKDVLLMVNNGEASYSNEDKHTLKVKLDDMVTVSLKDALTDATLYYIVAGTKRIPVVNGAASFKVTGTMDVTLIFTPLQEIKIIPTVGTVDGEGIYNHKITYTGKPYAYPYRTNPNTSAGNDGVKVNCRLSSAKPDAPNIGNPTNVGAYAFEFTRPADTKFKEATKVTARLTIDKATPVISELPTVTVENGQFKLKGGKAVFDGKECKGMFEVVTTSVPAASTLVEIKFTANDTHNFEVANAQVPVIIDKKAIDTYTVQIAKQLPAGVDEIVIKNGAYIVADGSKVEKDMKLSFKTVLAEGYYYDRNDPSQEGDFFLANEAGEKITGADLSSLPVAIDKNFRVNVSAPKRDNPQMTIVVNTSILSQETAYTTAAQRLKIDKIADLIQKSTEMTDVNLEDFILKYFDKDNKEIDLPVDAGTYKVTLYRPADETYKAVNETGRLVINPLTAKITKIPSASLIAQGQSLKNATLNGGEVKAALFEGTENERQIDVAGTFVWEEPVSNPVNGKSYRITFVPDDQVNFLCDATDAQVTAKVSNKMVVSWGNPQNGTVVVKVDDRILNSGDEIVKGEKLVITAVANNGFELESLAVNGSLRDNGTTYTVGDESVAITAIFKPKEVIVEKPIPTPPTAVKVVLRVNAPKGGYVLDMPMENVVDYGDNFSFTVKTADADKEKLSVIGGKETALASINGRFTLSGVKQDTVITITLMDPTKLKVAIEKETKNTEGYRLGTVEIENESKDSTYYYGDELILVAYPESGVTFTNWSDDVKLKEKYRTYVVTGDAVVKPVFKGTPTGIEEIETAEILGIEGAIVIRGIGEARVTIVGMDGHVQKQAVSGDCRIELVAGVYGVVLEQGSEKKQEKVIVR